MFSVHVVIPSSAKEPLNHCMHLLVCAALFGSVVRPRNAQTSGLHNQLLAEVCPAILGAAYSVQNHNSSPAAARSQGCLRPVDVSFLVVLVAIGHVRLLLPLLVIVPSSSSSSSS